MSSKLSLVARQNEDLLVDAIMEADHIRDGLHVVEAYCTDARKLLQEIRGQLQSFELPVPRPKQ